MTPMAAREDSRALFLRLSISLAALCIILASIYTFFDLYLEEIGAAFIFKARPLHLEGVFALHRPTVTSSLQYKHLPQPPPFFTHTPDGLIETTVNLLSSHKKLEDRLVSSVSIYEANFENTVLPLAYGENERSYETNLIAFYQYVSPSYELRNASTSAVKLVACGETDTLLRGDVYDLVAAAFDRKQLLDPKDQRLLHRFKQIYSKNGLSIPPGSNRTRFAEIQKWLSTVAASYISNLAGAPDNLLIDRHDLDGVPVEIAEYLDDTDQMRDSGSETILQLPLNDLVITPLVKYCKNATTRQRVFIAGENRHSRNVVLFKEAIILRDEAARLLGYPSHAALRVEDMMAKTPETVTGFLDGIQRGLASAAVAEIARLKVLKQADLAKSATDFSLWDYDYYEAIEVELGQGFNDEKAAEYFPLEHTVSSMLTIFATLFGLHFHELKALDYPALFANGAIWHADVRIYSVWDEPAARDDFLGYLYLDLHPREGKFQGAASFNIRPGFRWGNGTRSYPVSALVCNLAKPTKGKPSLLRHHEIVTLFHELGHSIHDIVSRTTYACFHGTSVAQDFVEAPSQMLENWCWEPSILKKLSKHYSYLSPSYYEAWNKSTIGHDDRKRPPEDIPDQMVQRLLSAKRSNTASSHLRSVHWSMFDMAVHQPATHAELVALDPASTYNRLRHNITMLDGPKGGYGWAHGYTTDGHLFQGYDATSYAYLYSLVFSADMFESVFRANPMNGTEGRRYRRVVLEPGGSMDELEVLREFLGRYPSAKAFYRVLGMP